MTVKESFDVVGMPSTWGIPEYKDNYPKKNAVIVDRLLHGRGGDFRQNQCSASPGGLAVL